jgi:hypothetical protein
MVLAARSEALTTSAGVQKVISWVGMGAGRRGGVAASAPISSARSVSAVAMSPLALQGLFLEL